MLSVTYPINILLTVLCQSDLTAWKKDTMLESSLLFQSYRLKLMPNDISPFQTCSPSICKNESLRSPQRETYKVLKDFHEGQKEQGQEVGIVLPVGCGKSGCIALAPFAFKSSRALVIAPNVKIAEQLHDDFDPTNSDMFYNKCGILSSGPYPEPVPIRGTSTNLGDLSEAHVVITNIQQLQGEDNRWLQAISNGFFDLILFDEGHHSIANSWNILRKKFPSANIVNFSATPMRSDGRPMAGTILYSYPVFKAIQEGYVKNLKALVLNPRTLRFVRKEGGKEIEVELEEVRQLGEEDSDFRRSILTSEKTLNTIVDASIGELEKLRQNSGEKRLKIIASALNYWHCHQIVAAYRSKGRRADYVHSKQEGKANERVLRRLDNHELDVIVQVRKLSEGFDHPYLAVAAVFSVFASLSPFVQFVGRIMRVIGKGAPNDVLNHGSVVFHAGANIARRWEDFQNYSQADQEFFDQLLLPVEEIDFDSEGEAEHTPSPSKVPEGGDVGDVRILGQTDILLEAIPLSIEDPEAHDALLVLQGKGFTGSRVREEFEKLKAIPTTKVKQRQAKRLHLDEEIRRQTRLVLATKRLNPDGFELDRRRLGRTNFVTLKSAIDIGVNSLVKKKKEERHNLNNKELDQILQNLPGIVDRVCEEVLDAKN